MSDFLVIGGGVMGLMLSRQLLRAGASVTLLEAGQCGREASWAGGGIVSPLYPWRYDPAVTALSSRAQQLFPVLCGELLQETGIDPEFRETGLLMLDAPDAAEAMRWSTENKIPAELVPAENLQTHVPPLAPGFRQGIWMPKIANIRNPRLLQALIASVRTRKSFTLLEFSPVAKLVADGDFTGVELLSGKKIAAGTVVVCAGAWAGQLLATVGSSLPVEPVLGQMLLYRMKPGWLKNMVLHEGRYAIPRNDGHVLVGSTLEKNGFDKCVSEASRATLQSAAVTMLPELRGTHPVRQWAGLRPGTSDGIPFMGSVPGLRNVWVCAGHYRNGLVLSPASAQFMADLLLEKKTEIDPQAYAVSRPK